MTTKLSEILAAGSAPKSIYKVEVDEESFSPPEGLEEIGFLFKSEAGDIDVTLVDVLISYVVSGVKVVLEIPAEAEDVDAQYYMSLAANTGISVSLLPPVEPTDEARAAYIERVSEFTVAYLGQANFAHFLYPVTSYLEYMFIETVRDVDGFRATDPYVVSTFVETTTEDFSDAMKAAIRAKVHAHFGGEDGFRSFAGTLFRRIHRQAESYCEDMARTNGEGAGEASSDGRGDAGAEEPVADSPSSVPA